MVKVCPFPLVIRRGWGSSRLRPPRPHALQDSSRGCFTHTPGGPILSVLLGHPLIVALWGKVIIFPLPGISEPFPSMFFRHDLYLPTFFQIVPMGVVYLTPFAHAFLRRLFHLLDLLRRSGRLGSLFLKSSSYGCLNGEDSSTLLCFSLSAVHDGPTPLQFLEQRGHSLASVARAHLSATTNNSDVLWISFVPSFSLILMSRTPSLKAIITAWGKCPG